MSEQEVVEREFVIPLGIVWGSPPKKRTPRAIREIREFIAKHMHVLCENVKLTAGLNEYLWKDGIRLNIRSVRVKAIKKGEIVKVSLPVEKLEEDKKK